MWIWITSVLLLGYLGFNRTFAYLGVPEWKLFVGEVGLAAFLLWGPRVNRDAWLRFTWKLPCLREYWTWYSLFLAYGILQVMYGIWLGHPVLTTLRDLAFNYYPLYVILGLWAGFMRPGLLPRLLRQFAWFNGLYGVLYIVALSRIQWFLPGVSDEVTPVSVFPEPLYSFVAILGVLAYEKSVRRNWYLLLLNGFVMLGMQFRSEWLACTVGLLTWAVLSHRGKQLVYGGAVLVSLVALLYFTHFTIPSPEGRAETDFSVKELVDRAAAPFRADLSDEKTAAGLSTVDYQEATFVFRTVWWLAIWDASQDTWRTALLGQGYGYALGDLVPYLEGRFIRTPHNAFFYALGYTGWIGVILYGLFEWQLVRLLWRSRDRAGEPFGIGLWVAMMTLAMFFPMGETPFGAIPFFLLIGLAAAAGLSSNRTLRLKSGNLPISAASSCSDSYPA